MPSRQRPTSLSETAQPKKRSSATATRSNIPANLQNSIPACAQSCLSAYIDQEYACSGNDVSCLCKQYSSEGFTLGELAFLCLRMDCPDATTQQETDAYNICSARSNAAHATHSTLTLPATSSTAMSTQPPSSSTTEPHQATTSVSSASPTISAATETTTITSLAISSSTPTTAASPAPSESGGSSSLTSAQAIGVSIAAIGAVIIAIATAYIIACMRRRKAKRAKEQRSSYDFVDEGPPKAPTFDHWASDPRGPLGSFYQPPVQTAEKHQTAWPSQYSQTIRQVQPPETDVAQNTCQGGSTSDNSHRTHNGVRVASQLLPDRPDSRPPPPPPKSPARWPQTPATVFEEERGVPFPPALLPGLPAHPAVHKAREPISQPVLALTIPGQLSRPDVVNVSNSFQLPPPPVFPARSSSRSNDGSSRNSLLDYYASPESGSPEDLYSTTPIDSGTQVRRPPPAAIMVTKPTYPPQAYRVSTASSDSRRTSFESTDPDEPTPPEEEDKRLTPVAESPIAGIRYPKIPRSSNQAVPRSPGSGLSPRSAAEFEGQHYRSPRHERRTEESAPRTPDGQRPAARSPIPALSGTTLAAKRRGDNAAQALEHGIHIADSAYASDTRKNNEKTSRALKSGQEVRPYRYESPLKGYGRVASRQQPNWPLTLEMKTPGSPPSLKSPLWEPKLTPRRMGDDLYLHVSVATPQTAHFSEVYNAR